MRSLLHHPNSVTARPRRAAASLDYVLILATMLPIVLFIVVKGKRIMQLVWEMLCVVISWPFM